MGILSTVSASYPVIIPMILKTLSNLSCIIVNVGDVVAC